MLARFRRQPIGDTFAPVRSSTSTTALTVSLPIPVLDGLGQISRSHEAVTEGSKSVQSRCKGFDCPNRCGGDIGLARSLTRCAKLVKLVLAKCTRTFGRRAQHSLSRAAILLCLNRSTSRQLSSVAARAMKLERELHPRRSERAIDLRVIRMLAMSLPARCSPL